MTQPFVPETPEETKMVEITYKELDLIQKLRRYPFGKFLIHKANNILVRVEITDSQLIRGEDEQKN